MSALARYLAFRRTLPPRPPLTRQVVRARGLDFAVYTTPPVGDSPPLLCINGGLLFDHTLLWPALAPLATDRQLIFYDQRGRGHSAVPPGLAASRIEFDAGDVPALRQALGVDTWDVLGHSWGGGIALLSTALDVATSPQAVRRLVLVNAVGLTAHWLPPLHTAALARLAAHPASAEAYARLAALDPATLDTPDLTAHADYAQAFFPAWFADLDFARQVSAPRGDSLTGAHVAARLRREGYDWTALLQTLGVRTLLVHGSDDVLPIDEAKATQRALPHASLVPIPHAGHNPFWESPVTFFEVVRGFLSAP